jgi:CHASE3 domain sensor protein
MAYGKKTEKNKAGYMIGCFVAVLAITYLFFNILDGWHKYKESNKRLQASISSIEDLTGQYEDLKKTKALEESTTGYEMHIRSKFNMNKPDEKVVFITSEEVQEPVEEDKGFKKMMNTFKNFFN